MRQSIYAVLCAVLVAAFLVGCCGPAGLFGTGGHVARFLFVVGDADVGAFTVNPDTGAVTPVSGSPFAPGTGSSVCPDHAIANPSGQFLFVPDPCNSNIAVFSINRNTGALTAITGSPFSGGTSVQQPAIDPTGTFLYIPDDFNNQIFGFKIAANGALSAISGSPFAAAGSDEGIAIHPNGKFLYVGTQTGPILGYSIDATSGALTPMSGSPFPTSTTTPNPPATKFLVVHPAGNFLYVTDPDNDNVEAFSINTTSGALTLLTASPFSTGVTGSNPQGMAVSPNGNFLFVANNGDLDTATNGNVAAFTINSSTGALTPATGSPFTAGTNPKNVAVDPSGRFVYVTNEDAGEAPIAPAVRLAAAAAAPGDGGLSGFSVNQETGVLTPIPGSPFTTNVGPEGVTLTQH